MRIPPKRVAQEQIQGQRKQQIDEGVLVAKKVDAMRQELASLQKQRLDFIQNTSIEIESATKPLHQIKTNLENEIKTLELKKEEASKPLTEGRIKLNKVKEIFEREMAMLIVQKTEQGQREVDLVKREKELSDKETTIDNLKRQTYKFLEEAKSEKEDADKILKDSQARSDKLRNQFDNEFIEIVKQNQQNKFDLEAVNQVRKLNERKEKELNIRERQINDKYATLLRSQKRLKK